MESELQQLRQQNGAEIAVVTIRSLEGAPIEDYAVELFERWGIGGEGQDNGVLLLVAVEDREIRIEVGYGLEPVITDSRAGRMIREVIAPELSEGDYDAGLTAGAAALSELAFEGQPPGPLEENPVRDRFEQWGWLLWVVGFFSIYLLGFMARSRSVFVGPLWGAGVGAFLGLLIGGIIAVAVTAAIVGLIGLIIDAVLSANYKTLSRAGRSTGFFNSWGGWRGAGGGFRSGGGFGGFGGGRSGGGGASGRF
jgi:uncharacterized protein